MKTPVYDGEEGKISPSCPIWEPTLGVSMLLEKAALRRFILPAVLRELFLTGCALTPVVLAHCEEKSCCLWSHDCTVVEVACPKSDLRIRLATQRECCVTSTTFYKTGPKKSFQLTDICSFENPHSLQFWFRPTRLLSAQNVNIMKLVIL